MGQNVVGMIEPVSTDYFEERLNPLLNQMLWRPNDEVDWRRPFSEQLAFRLILSPTAFDVPGPVVTRLGADDISSEGFALSNLTRFPGVANDWIVTGADLDGYRAVITVGIEHVLYSPRGKWAVLANEEYAVVGCASSSVRDAINEAAGEFADPGRFVAQVREA